MIETRSYGGCDRERTFSASLNSVRLLENVRSSQNASWGNLFPVCLHVAALLFVCLVAGCAAYGPDDANTRDKPSNSIRGPKDGRYKMAFIEFGDQGSMLDPSQLGAALGVIEKAQRPLLFVYIHGWQNNAVSGDVCKFEHFLDTVSSFPEAAGQKVNVSGVYIAWRGRDLTIPGLNLLTFYSRKAVGGQIAAQNSCLATINEL